MQSNEYVDYGIAEEAVTRICQNRARHINSEALQAGESNRVSANDLEDMYYQQKGCCNYCGVQVEDHGASKHPNAIRLDHIRNVNRRSTFKAVANGERATGAAIADIANLQWICHACNTMKQIVVGYGMDWVDYVLRCHQQAAAGFPIRSNLEPCGSQSSRRGKRISWMREQFAISGHSLSSTDVVKHFEGTPLECNIATILKELKSIGWCGMRHMSQVRRAIAQEMCEASLESLSEKPFFKDWCCEFNEIVAARHGWPPISCCAFRKLCDEEGLVFFTSRDDSRRLERNATSSEKALVRQFLKEKGIVGASEDEIQSVLQSDTFTDGLMKKAIEELSEVGQIERHEERYFYCMDRKEAAAVIGVSVHRLKKYAVYGNGPVFLKTPRNTKGNCYYSVRTLYEWAAARHKTRFDVIGWQGRAAAESPKRLVDACVNSPHSAGTTGRSPCAATAKSAANDVQRVLPGL